MLIFTDAGTHHVFVSSLLHLGHNSMLVLPKCSKSQQKHALMHRGLISELRRKRESLLLTHLVRWLCNKCAQLPALSKHTMYLNWCGIEVGSAMQISVASMACPCSSKCGMPPSRVVTSSDCHIIYLGRGVQASVQGFTL